MEKKQEIVFKGEIFKQGELFKTWKHRKIYLVKEGGELKLNYYKENEQKGSLVIDRSSDSIGMVRNITYRLYLNTNTKTNSQALLFLIFTTIRRDVL